MNDYQILTGYGLPLSFNKKVRIADKGHKQLLKLFIQAARIPNKNSPIPFERIYTATKTSLIVDQLARIGGGYKHLSTSTNTV